MSKIQTYTEGEGEMGKESKLLGRVTTLGADRYVITIAKEDNDVVKGLKGKRVFVTVREATSE